MNTCATCKHWRTGPNGVIDHGACIKIENGSWDDIALTGCDDFGDNAPLYCRPTFGCTLWQAREGAPDCPHPHEHVAAECERCAKLAEDPELFASLVRASEQSEIKRALQDLAAKIRMGT